VIERYLSKQKSWLKTIQSNIENIIHIDLYKMVGIVNKTSLYITTADEIITNDDAILFLSNRDQLRDKIRDYVNADNELASILAEIDELPRQKSEECSKKMSMLLGLSVLPVGNIITMLPISSLLRKFMPGLKSSNAFYVALKETLKKKLSLYFYFHIVLAVVSIGLCFSPTGMPIALPIFAILSYVLSSANLYARSMKLKRINLLTPELAFSAIAAPTETIDSPSTSL
jgi:hypothetical protein